MSADPPKLPCLVDSVKPLLRVQSPSRLLFSQGLTLPTGQAALPDRPAKRVRSVREAEVGVVVDSSLSQHKHPQRRHPERPERVEAIVSHLERTGLLRLCETLSAREAREEELTRVHNKHWVERLRVLQVDPASCSLRQAWACEGYGDDNRVLAELIRDPALPLTLILRRANPPPSRTSNDVV